MNAFSLVSAVLLVNLLTIGFYASAQEAAKTKCYQCDELSDAGCKDPFNNNEGFIKDCENGETFCRKTVQFVNEKSSVIRQCAKELYKENYEGCYKTAGKATQNVCTCKPKDGKPCNSGIELKSTGLALALSLFMSLLLLK